MIQGIIENDERHFLRRVLFVVGVELLDGNVFHMLVIRASLINKWSQLKKLTVFIDNIFAHEVCKLELSQDFTLFEVEGLSEFFLGNSVKDILESFLVRRTNQLIDECTLALMAPQANHE